MGERHNAMSLLGIRFMLCIAVGWFGITSLRQCLKIDHLDILRSSPYNPNIIPAQIVASAGGVFLFFWTFATLPSICNAHGGPLIIIELIDIATITVCCVALGFQTEFLPHNLNNCKNGDEMTWQVGPGIPSLFSLMAGPDATDATTSKECKLMVHLWVIGIVVVVLYGMSAVYNLSMAVRELGQSSCFWMHDFHGRRRKWSTLVVTICFPLFAIEYIMEMLWKSVPTKTMIEHRYSRRHDEKLQEYKKFHSKICEQSPAESPLSALTGKLRLKQTPNLDSVALRDMPKSGGAQVTSVPEEVIKSSDETAPVTDSQPLPPSDQFLARLPWHLIVNDLLPYLHNVDVLNLLLTSRSTNKALMPGGEDTQRTLRHNACYPDDVEDYSDFYSYNYGVQVPASPSQSLSFCFGCTIPLCNPCTQFREMAETPMTVHTRTCQAICESCYRSFLEAKSQYFDRQHKGPCGCGHNHFLRARELPPDDSSYSVTAPAFMSCWSAFGEGGMLVRSLCRNCASLSNEDVKKKREDRHRKKSIKANEVDAEGHRCAFECSQCLKLQPISGSKNPVMFFLCKQCKKECRFNGHDQWVVEDALRKRAKGALDSPNPGRSLPVYAEVVSV